MTDRPDLHIGDTLWIFDGNRRVYPPAAAGRTRSPIYREHWVAHTITGETRQSWLLDGGNAKVSKVRAQGPRSYAATAQEVEDDVWCNAHYAGLHDAIRTATPAQMRQIAALLNYAPEARP
ncbi:hypothetical protein [Deinococcus kurensis]|uniref:hypothetical protein n=1 Tax=Deinococcus kurensis TaxID=2662757 RepID=UPI0012D2DE0E|nr:hypothetical protein [Deinococcus kurensis]